mmetsp:Transcript_31388/g.63726  ORF Transcript_31388/g.63726 Transcript_31388/m.63726 type:complete len:245 (-) Transcript_31388:388-1122(-)
MQSKGASASTPKTTTSRPPRPVHQEELEAVDYSSRPHTVSFLEESSTFWTHRTLTRLPRQPRQRPPPFQVPAAAPAPAAATAAAAAAAGDTGKNAGRVRADQTSYAASTTRTTAVPRCVSAPKHHRMHQVHRGTECGSHRLRRHRRRHRRRSILTATPTLRTPTPRAATKKKTKTCPPTTWTTWKSSAKADLSASFSPRRRVLETAARLSRQLLPQLTAAAATTPPPSTSCGSSSPWCGSSGPT